MFSFTGITKNCQLLYDSGLSSPGAVFSLVDLGPGAAVGGMQIEMIICKRLAPTDDHLQEAGSSG